MVNMYIQYLLIMVFVGFANLQTEREKPKKLHEVNRTSLYQTPGKVMWESLTYFFS